MIEDRQPIDIHLYGPLADKYGALHRLAVMTPHEAVRALDANFPGFIRDFAAHRIYHVLADGDWRDGDQAATMPVSRELHLVPQVEGRAFLGALLISTLFPAIGATAASIIGGALFLGVMVGLSFLFRPKTPDQKSDERNEGFAFTGPENVVTQGAPVPLAYGRVHCGSVVVSAGLEVAELGSWVTQKDLNNELRSKQFARIIDVISDGQISGFRSASDIFLDGVPMPNFQNTQFQWQSGYRTQPILSGFPSQENEIPVGLELEYGNPLTRGISNLDVDRVRITLSTPQLTNIDLTSGDVDGFTVPYSVHITNAGGPPVVYLIHSMSGKTQSRYQRSYLLTLPRPGPWTIIVQRGAPKSMNPDHASDLFFDSYTEIIDDRVNYNGTAVAGLFLDSEQFSTIPKRTYLIEGIRVLVPSNYEPNNAIYTGVWDGTFKIAWTNNPAWVLFDILVSYRHGIGNFLSPAQVDKWALYSIGQWCDERVPDGKGGVERRFTCNIQITSQQEAFDLIAQIASIFRGFTYWSGTQMVAVADLPSDPVHQFTNANVIDGTFTYSGSDLRARHTMATVAWSDPANLGQPRLAVVEDPPAISRYGIQATEIEALGCTSEGQAIRTGKWALYTELYEGEAVTFATGLESAFARPGEIIQVADVNVAGVRFGGRVVSADPPSGGVVLINLDHPVPIGAAGVTGAYFITCMMGDGHIETRQIAQPAVEAALLQVAAFGMSEAPAPDTVFMVATAALEPTLWRVISVRQADADKYEINAVRHFPGKWAYVENNIPITVPNVSVIPVAWPAVINLAIREYLIQTSPISVGVRVILSWSSAAPLFEVSCRPQDGNWTTTRTEAQAIDLPVTEGPWQFRITPISAIGVRGPVATLNYTVIGRFAPPSAPQQFRVKISDGVALFEWLPATELDVIVGGHFELRHSSQTSGASWNSAQVVIPSIPGSATTVEAVYRVGTWFLRTFDIVGIQSASVATIIALQPDGRYNQFARICENPDWLGTHNYTEVLEPQQWLVLGQTGGMWDVQLADMDSWPDVDVLVEGMPDPPQSEPRHGWYMFDNRIDAGGVFTVRFSADILAFPYQEGSDFIDDRLNNSDEWQDWDDVGSDLNGQVQLFIRTTNDDPASPSAAWGNWQVFSPIEYTARGFEFRADLTAPVGQNIGVEQLCIIADLRMKMDSAEDVPYPAATTHVTFTVKFYLVPAVVVTVQDALATDQIQVLNKTRQGFDIDIRNAGAQVTRTFDFQARGF
jgi:predicted phage tail protein